MTSIAFFILIMQAVLPKLPVDFETQMKLSLGNEFQSFKIALQEKAPVSVRFNANKQINQNTNLEQVLWSENAYYLEERPVFTLDPTFHAGGYYVQEASSMFIDFLIRQLFPPDRPLVALDLCAAPGGKSTLLANRLPPSSLLIANEVIKNRYLILRENLIKWGTSHLITTQVDSQNYQQFTNFFDLVLVDAPCSGEGLFRKDPRAASEWSKDHVKLCSARQKRILGNIVNSLKANGVLIYCTCTYNEEENTRNAEWLKTQFDLNPIELSIPPAWKISQKSIGYQFYPHKTKGEGFYVSIFRKEGHAKAKEKKDKGLKHYKRLPKSEVSRITPWITHANEYQFYLNPKQQIIAFPKVHSALLPQIDRALNKFEMGTLLGEIKGQQFVPAHALALSSLLNPNIPQIELTKNQALHYLARENIQISPPNMGWNIVTYQGIQLGWVKKVANRINNYYPKAWRIRMRLPKA